MRSLAAQRPPKKSSKTRATLGRDLVRLISARRATRHERRRYEEGLVVQVGRGRPKRLLESGGTTPRSVRFSDEIWTLLEKRAQAKGITLHAALREAILEWARHAA